MNRVTRLTWIASVDMEHLVGAILGSGTVLSFGLVIAGLMLRAAIGGPVGIEEPLYGTNVLQFILADLHRLSPQLWPVVLTHLGVAVLLVSPYVRVLVSLLSFAFLERSWSHTLLTGSVLTLLTYILFLG